MRFVNVTGYNARSWRKTAQRKTIELFASESAGNEKIFFNIPSNQVWTLLRPTFERLSNNKCWFSEAYASVSDFEVEHFRPKKAVHLIKSKDPYPEKRTVTCAKGYWWLAYDFENLRLAGGKPNRKKGNYFPLETTSVVANSNKISWRREKSILLDPCVKTDIELISYEGTEPVPTNPDPVCLDHIRARISIEIYGLRLGKLKIARSRVFEEAKNYYDLALMNWNAMTSYNAVNQEAHDLAKQNFNMACANLVMMLKPNKEFTRMIYSFLSGVNQSWVDDFIIQPGRHHRFI
jgi:hypothetical protein